MAGILRAIELIIPLSLKFATGKTLLANRKAVILIRIANKKRGLNDRMRLIPADLEATNSKFSAVVPKVMMDDNNTAIGKAMGTRDADA